VKKLPVHLDLFLTLAKVGLFTFGGGYAMIGVIEHACVEQKGWLTHEEMVDMTVVAESTPGPIAINCATYVGYKAAGFSGALAGTLGIVLPSFVIVYLISMFLEQVMDYPLVANAFRGIKVAVGLLILQAGWNMVKKMKKKPLAVGILAVSLMLMLVANLFGVKLSSIVLMAAAGVLSWIICLAKRGGVHRDPH